MYQNLKKALIFCALSVNLSLSADLPEPYASVQNLPYTPYFVLDGYTFNELITSHQAAVIIDVDSQDGGVSRYLAQQVQNLPSITNIYSISIWQTSDHTQKFLFQRFLSNVIQENTTALITPIRMSSLEAANATNIMADFISLVGGNDQHSIFSEILAWYPHLSDTGIICGNNWSDNAIQVGVTRAASLLDLNLQIIGNVWCFQKNLQQ